MVERRRVLLLVIVETGCVGDRMVVRWRVGLLVMLRLMVSLLLLLRHHLILVIVVWR